MPRNEEDQAILKDRNGDTVALKGVSVRGRLHGFMAEVEVEQHYVNPKKTNIEAIYTFPLPLGATLLGLEIEISGKKLTGSVVEKKQAERQYEDAITDGDSAIMLEEAGPGLYTVSIGNLMADESAVIRYRYALLLAWQGDRIRFLLPTTIAPRYGNPQAAGLQPHLTPITSLVVDYPLDISIIVEGDLASASIASPSHPIAVQQSGNGMVVKLAGKACLDRDFILTIQSDTVQSSCEITPDGKKQVALASLRIPPATDTENRQLVLKVVIDCSGSMAGTSISQARKAALEILNQLRPQDKFNVTLFGNTFSHIFPKPMLASEKNITEARNRLDKLDADMGGTEMEKALVDVFSMGNQEESASVLLITDGEIHEHEKLVKRAQQSGHRIFTVGVGNAVAEAFLISLSNVTGGACELVAPQEGMSERVLSQFHRMNQPILGEFHIEWPTSTEWQTPLPYSVFAGDTVQVFAGFLKPVDGIVKLIVQGTCVVTSPIVSANEAQIPRVAAARRIAMAREEDGLHLALDYQLLSRWTNFLVIAERSDKADDLPELHQVPQMLAAGWGGVGYDRGAKHCVDHVETISTTNYKVLEMPAIMRTGRHRDAATISLESSGIDMLDIPSFLRKNANEPTLTPAIFIAKFTNSYTSFLRQPKLPKSITELENVGIGSDMTNRLLKYIAQGYDEAEVVAAFIYALSQSAIGEKFSRSYTRAILKHWKQVVKNHEIDVEMQVGLASVTTDSWNWQSQAMIV